jgi:hypothetical protein
MNIDLFYSSRRSFQMKAFSLIFLALTLSATVRCFSRRDSVFKISRADTNRPLPKNSKQDFWQQSESR